MSRLINIILVVCGLLFLVECAGYLDEVKTLVHTTLSRVTEALE